MFKVQRQNKESRSGERIDFKFSNFQAIQVPKGWDKLLVSVVSVETGKTIAKSSKAHVRNGNCQWTETLSESIWISHDESVKVLEERLFKFVVSMGSARSGILGEVTVNVAEYVNKKAPPPVVLPLQKCNYGSILQVKIQCLTPKVKLRSKDSKDSSYSAEDRNGDHQDLENKSNSSDDSLARNSVSLSSKDLGSTSHPGELISREASFSSTGSHHSFGSAESYSRRGNVTVRNDVNGGRQNSTSSVNSSPHGDYHAEDSYKSSPSSFKSRASDPGNDPQHQWQESAQSPARFMESGSSKNYLEVAEDTINELRGEAKTWERNARKLMLELDILKKEFSVLSKKQANNDMELSEAYAERDGLKRQVEQLKLLSKEVAREDPSLPSEGPIHLQKEMENEIKYQRECNANLTQQLQRSQESNIELVNILQELEETIEKQKADMESFSTMQMKVSEMENDCSQNNQTLGDIETKYRNELLLKEKEIADLESKLSEYFVNKPSEEIVSSDGRSKEDLMREIESLKQKLEELEQDCNELTNENLELLYKLKNSSKNGSIEPTSPGYGLRAISFSMSNPQEMKEELKETATENDRIADVAEQLQIAFHRLEKPWYDNSSHMRDDYKFEHIELNKLTSPEECVNAMLDSLIELNKLLEARIELCGESLRNGELKLEESKYDIAEAQKKLEDHVLKEKNLNLHIQELESINMDLRDNLTGLEKELIERGSAITAYEAKLSSDDEEIRLLRQCQKELEAQICGLRKEKDQIQKQKSDLEKEIMNSESIALGLEDEIRRLGHEMETEKFNLNKKLKDTENQLSEAKEESENLKREIQKLLVSAHNLTEECSSLEKENELLRKQCTRLETQLKESQINCSELAEKVEALEEKISSMLEDFTMKEKILSSELDALLHENVEKRTEIENLKRQISFTRDEGEEIASKAAHEVSSLRASNAMLESSLQEIQSKFRLAENEIDEVKKYSELKVQYLMAELSTTRRNHELLVADYEKKLKFLGSYMSSEEKMNASLNDLELKLTVSECERQQLIEEIASLKTQLQEATRLQDEIVTLESELGASIVEKKKIEVSLEELKSEKISFLEKVNRLEAVIAELELCKGDNVALEEKLQKMEGDLSAKQMFAKDAELGYQLKIQELEVEKDEYSKRIEALEEQLKLMEERMKERNQSRNKKGDKYSFQNESPRASVDQTELVQLLENELAQALEANNKYKIQLQRVSSEGRNNHANGLKKPTAEGEVVPKERFERTKSSLETELKDLRERYFHMSLQYAEVEAQREELVMKLKASKSGKKWFS